MTFQFWGLRIDLFSHTAGLFHLGWQSPKDDYAPIFALHLAVKPRYWALGYWHTWFGRPLKSVGLGPFLLLAWVPRSKPKKAVIREDAVI
jgi:hypothetical protein